MEKQSFKTKLRNTDEPVTVEYVDLQDGPDIKAVRLNGVDIYYDLPLMAVCRIESDALKHAKKSLTSKAFTNTSIVGRIADSA